MTNFLEATRYLERARARGRSTDDEKAFAIRLEAEWRETNFQEECRATFEGMPTWFDLLEGKPRPPHRFSVDEAQELRGESKPRDREPGPSRREIVHYLVRAGWGATLDEVWWSRNGVRLLMHQAFARQLKSDRAILKRIETRLYIVGKLPERE